MTLYKPKLNVCQREADGSVEVNHEVGSIEDTMRLLFSKRGLKDIISLRKEAAVTGKDIILKLRSWGTAHINPETSPIDIATEISIQKIANSGVDLSKVRKDETGTIIRTDANDKLYSAAGYARHIISTAADSQEAFNALLAESRIGRTSAVKTR